MAPISRRFLRAREMVEPLRVNNQPQANDSLHGTIDLDIFLAVFASTIFIFIVTVVFWKFGAFMRLFTRHKIVGGGKAAAIPYAKTWHGWVPLAEHEKHRARRKRRFKQLRQKIVRRSNRADYSWVWWDPKGNEFYRNTGDKDGVRWVAQYFRSYRLQRTDVICNPGPPSRNLKSPGTCEPMQTQHLLEKGEIAKSVPSPRPALQTIVSRVATRIKRPATACVPSLSDVHRQTAIQTSIVQGLRGGNKGLGVTAEDSSAVTPRRKDQGSFEDGFQPPSQDLKRSNRSVPCLPLSLKTEHISVPPRNVSRRRCVSDGDHGGITLTAVFHSPRQTQDRLGAKVPVKNRTWKYRVLGARMHCKGYSNSTLNLGGLVGRPGSPASEALNSMISSPSESEYHGRALRTALQYHAVDTSTSKHHSQSRKDISSRARHDPTQSNELVKVPLPLNRVRPAPEKTSDGGRNLPVSCSPDECFSQTPPLPQMARPVAKSRRSVSETLSRSFGGVAIPESCRRRRRTASESDPGTLRRMHLSHSEIQLINNLDRRLEWLASEMDPGRKLSNFSLVHSHWLNMATWAVYDPVSRVSCENKRMFGDPRFNNLPRRPESRFKPKYSAQTRPRANTPRIDSWRLAVNRERKSAGIQEFLRAIELFEGSADEPRAEDIDPAAWMLRRPPQGYGPSNKQKNAYYEGGAGWCETLPDWQKVRRGYRIRKAIYEGRANRRRVAELAKSVGGGYRMLARKVTPIWVPKVRNEKDAEKQRREQRSGYGTIPRRLDGKRDFQNPAAIRRTPSFRRPDW
ncbi:hypothetical protein VTO42DRAFT_1434 [Malbranchea cinnamomea]